MQQHAPLQVQLLLLLLLLLPLGPQEPSCC
jgi:hypothetical protein